MSTTQLTLQTKSFNAPDETQTPKGHYGNRQIWGYVNRQNDL